jgi:sialate O-acetylesterase
MNRLLLRCAVALSLLAGFSTGSYAEVRLPNVFGSHMVLQRDQPVPVWGWADKDEEVTVSIRDQKKSAKAGDDGRWQVMLDALAVGEPASLVVEGKNQLTFEDVLVGEVWVCSGQSNMEWSVRQAIDSDLETLAAANSQLRLLSVQKATKPEAQTDIVGSWQTCTPETIPNFSAVAYFFGRQLQETLHVPVGLINTSWGGTRAEAWTSPEGMTSKEELKPILETWAKAIDTYSPENARKDYDEAIAQWRKAVQEAKDKGAKPPQKPNLKADPKLSHDRPSNLYNGMIAPLVPYAIRGAIWYQGESNAGRAYQYRTLMPTMIRSWRNVWKQGDFPFYMVQLANFMEPKSEPQDSAWAELREAQMLTIDAEKNVGVACIIDIGAAKDIHPKDKQNVGKRLARLALVDLYDLAGKIARNGPTYRSMDIEDGRCVIHFDNLGEGNFRGISGWYNEPLRGFAIAGADKKFVWAEAKVDGDTVVVSSPEVKEPLAVRYDWADNPRGNLYNKAMLPAYPFRTDDWEGVTKDKVNP